MTSILFISLITLYKFISLDSVQISYLDDKHYRIKYSTLNSSDGFYYSKNICFSLDQNICNILLNIRGKAKIIS